MISSMPRLAATVPVRYAHAISNPTLANIEGRWEKMSEDERVDIIDQLAERQKGPWGELTPAEKKAAWYISYGAWGPRKPTHPPGEVKKIVYGIFGVIAAAATIFGIFRLSAPAPPHTMSKEWQEAVNDVLKENKANPFSGYDQVQSVSKGPLPEGDDDDDE